MTSLIVESPSLHEHPGRKCGMEKSFREEGSDVFFSNHAKYAVLFFFDLRT